MLTETFDTVPASVPPWTHIGRQSFASCAPVFGLLREVYSDRIVAGDRTLFLQDRQACHHAVERVLEIVFTEQSGRAGVKRISVAGRPESPEFVDKL